MKKGQATIEYALLIAIVAAAFTAMHLYVQRAVQANFKLIEEQVNVVPIQGATGGSVSTSTPSSPPSSTPSQPMPNVP